MPTSRTVNWNLSVHRERRARGATDGMREEPRRRRAARCATRTPLLDCGGDQPPAMHVRCARRARVVRRPPRAAPSLRAQRRSKRRRETRTTTTTGDGTREEPRSTVARERPCSTAAVINHPCDSRARRRRACASASPRPPRSPRRRTKAARRVSAEPVVPAERRTTTRTMRRVGAMGQR